MKKWNLAERKGDTMRKPRHQLTQWMQSEETYEEWEQREKEAHERQREILIQILEGIKADHKKEKENNEG